MKKQNNWTKALEEKDIIVDDDFLRKILEKPASEKSPKDVAYIETIVENNEFLIKYKNTPNLTDMCK